MDAGVAPGYIASGQLMEEESIENSRQMDLC
jgi:hypothetical protein